MRKISANYIFPVKSPPIKNGILIINNDGSIVDIVDNNGELHEKGGLEFYNGILVPGFVNTHCHLELSYLKNEIEEKQQLTGFIFNLIDRRDKFSYDEIENAAIKADIQMYKDGIVAVGDISNTVNTIPVKMKSKIHYHTFVEIFGSKNENAKKVFENGVKVKNKFMKNKLKASIVPHAPYSISSNLLELFKEYYLDNHEIVSIHNQENEDENLMFRNGTGSIYEMISKMGTNLKDWRPYRSNSINYYFNALNDRNNKILVHNTFSQQEDIDFALSVSGNTYWCLCPNANLYIEDKLPEIDLFHKNGLNITIGTDSLASNHMLSVLNELQVVAKYFPDIPFNNLIEWATINGAKALEINDIYGSLEIGKKPGVVLIEHFDFEKMTLSSLSKCKRII